MVRKFLIFFMVLCLTASPAFADIWIFGKKNSGNSDSSSQIYVNPKIPAQGSFVNKLFGLKPAPGSASAKSLSLQKFQNLKPEMLMASYSPKNSGEMVVIANAHRDWQDQALARMNKDADDRIAMAAMDSHAGMERLDQMDKAYQAKAGAASPPVNYSAPYSGERTIYNKPVSQPTKVFKNYR